MEGILLQNSKNIASLIQLMKVHEENTSRIHKILPEDNDIMMKPVFYTEGDYGSLVSPTIKTCSLTRTSFTATDRVILLRECGHLFKKEPFLEWMKTYSVCPRCNRQLL